MIERAFVHVGGPPGSGKTTFIEAMLAGADALTLVARCLRDDTLAQVREVAPRTHPELRRYRQTRLTRVSATSCCRAGASRSGVRRSIRCS